MDIARKILSSDYPWPPGTELPQFKSSCPNYSELKHAIRFMMYQSVVIRETSETLHAYDPETEENLQLCMKADSKMYGWSETINSIILCYIYAFMYKFRVPSKYRQIFKQHMGDILMNAQAFRHHNTARNVYKLILKQDTNIPEKEKMRRTLIMAGQCDDIANLISSFAPHETTSVYVNKNSSRYKGIPKNAMYTYAKSGYKKYF